MSFNKLTTRILIICLSLLLASGCNIIYRGMGDILVNFGEDVLLPYSLADNDMELGCQSVATTPLLMSFRDVGSDPRELATMLYLVAGSCAENKARTHERNYLRALTVGDSLTAQNERIEQKRAHELAAKRFYKSHNLMLDYFEPTDGECPRISGDLEEFVWMMGMLSGLLAVTNDAGADLSVGIPRNIPAQVNRWATCIPNKKWWGMPNGMRAAIWGILPLLKPEGADADEFLLEAQQLGLNSGIRIGFALRAIAAKSSGKGELVRATIKDFAKLTNEGFTPNTEFLMIDTMSKNIIQQLSDTIWSEEEGTLTPFGRLGEFPGENDFESESDEDFIDIDDLL